MNSGNDWNFDSESELKIMYFLNSDKFSPIWTSFDQSDQFHAGLDKFIFVNAPALQVLTCDFRGEMSRVLPAAWPSLLDWNCDPTRNIWLKTKLAK